MAIFLKKLELLGFKSFPEKTTIKFHPGINAIIGPNGCGKSNVVDAILWVLGEQKLKHLRADESEDLIFAGSAHKKPFSYTEVRLTIANEKEETEIARKLFRNGETKYLLNERQQRLKDIQSKLYDLQIGDRNYFVFEQGSIDKVISMKSQERRLLIEEAAGIALYLERKKEIATKLIVAEQNLEQLQLLIQEKEKRLRQLKKQLHFVERYRSLRKERQEKLFIILAVRFSQSNNKNQNLRCNLAEVNNRELQLLQQISQIEKTILSLEEETWQTRQNLNKKRESMLTLSGQLSELEKEHSRLIQLVDFTRRDIKQQEMEHDRLSAEADQLRSQQQKEDDSDFSMAIASLRREQENLRQESQQIKKELDQLNASDEELKRKLFALRSQEAELQNFLLKKERALLQTESILQHVTAGLLQTENNLRSFNIDKEEQMLQKLEDKRDELKKSKDHLDKKLKEEEEELTQIQQEEMVWQNKLAELQTTRKSYEQLKSALAPKNGKNTNLQRIADELQADPNFRSQLENFFYDELDLPFTFSLTETSAADFSALFLGKQRPPLNRNQLKEIPGFCGLVSDFYQTIRPELKASLKDGVVVENFQQALAAFQQYDLEIVSRDGAYFSRNGVVFCRREKGILEINATLRELEKKIPEVEKELQKISKQKKESVEFSVGLKKELFELEAELKKVENEIFKIGTGINFLKNEERKLQNEKKAALHEKEEQERQKIEILAEMKRLENEKLELQTMLATIDKDRQQKLTLRNDLLVKFQHFSTQLTSLQAEEKILLEKDRLRKGLQSSLTFS